MTQVTRFLQEISFRLVSIPGHLIERLNPWKNKHYQGA